MLIFPHGQPRAISQSRKPIAKATSTVTPITIPDLVLTVGTPIASAFASPDADTMGTGSSAALGTGAAGPEPEPEPGEEDCEPSVVTALLVVQAPRSVDMTFMFVSAAGVEPQLAAGAIHTTLFSRSKVAVTR